MVQQDKILVVDDEVDLCEILKFNLEHEGFLVDCAFSAEEALNLLSGSDDYQLILLDVMMGGMSGFKMAEHLHKEMNNHTPIIFLTARDTENDMLTGFSLGGDDYISKPFSVKEVIARAKAVLKRTNTNQDGAKQKNMFAVNGLKIDVDSKQVWLDGEEVVLTKMEFEILLHIMQNPGKIYSRENILQIVWPNDAHVLERTVDVHVARLRKKLGIYGQYIKNRSGYGYCFDPHA